MHVPCMYYKSLQYYYSTVYCTAWKMYMHSSGIVHVHVYEQFDFTICM